MPLSKSSNIKAQSDAEYVKGLQALLETARNSIESALAQERAIADQNLKVQKADAFHTGFEEGSRLPAEMSIKSPEEYEEQIDLFGTVDRFVSTPSNLRLLESSLVVSPSFNPDSFFATSEPSK